MLLRCLALLPSVAALAQAPLDTLLATLHEPGTAAQLRTMQEFARRDDAAAVVPGLLQRIAAEAPGLDNNGCLELEMIFHAHPECVCAPDVLLDVLGRRIWNSQQKSAQALAVLLRPDLVKGQEERLARAVIPLLISQRSRVYTAAARCLSTIAGRDLGADPVAARDWYHQRFGKALDLEAARYELVLVVHAAADGSFDVQGQHVADLPSLTERFRAERIAAERRGLHVGAVVQLPDTELNRMLEHDDLAAVDAVLQAIAAAGIPGTTVSPESDVFRAPFVDEGDDAAALRARLTAALATLRGDRVPGAVGAVVLPNGHLIEFADGVADRDQAARMPVDGRLLAGSTGKTFFAALALQLVREGRLDLDAKVGTWLGDRDWFARVPNAADVTVRQLMQHRSGIMRYELAPAFLRALHERPDHRFTPDEELAFVLDRSPRFAAGDGFDYADTNYVLLGLILEHITGRPCYDEIRSRFLEPLHLAGTVPGVGLRVPGLLQCYAGDDHLFSDRDAMLVDGALPFDPGFEGAGGGFATTAGDLARWAKALYEGDVLRGVREVALDGQPAPLGPGARYGLGVMIDRTELGSAWGHSGFFPGSMSAMRYYPDRKIAVAVMVNSSADARLALALVAWTTKLAGVANDR